MLKSNKVRQSNAAVALAASLAISSSSAATQSTASTYPPVGKIAVVNFGGAKFRLDFKNANTMSFEDISGAFQGVRDTVQYTAVQVSPGVFMVYWHEPSTGSNVVHVQDWNSGTVYTNIAGKNGSFLHLIGTIRIVSIDQGG